MRLCALRTWAWVAGVILSAGPAAAFERLPQPDAGASLMTAVADLDARDRVYRHRDSDGYRAHYRAAYTRWLHNEYVRAGYPIEHKQYRTYVRAVPCCCCDRW